MGKRTDRADERWGRAVVVGGGYAGLVTARVLADHFREVVVLERDPVDGDTGVHPNAPQGYHAHAMLARGAQILERYFPGLRAGLEEAGAPVYDYGERISFLTPAGFAPRCRTGVRIQSFTRDELERRLRRTVLALPQVTLIAPARCEGLGTDRTGAVDRVRYRLVAAGAGDGAAEPDAPAPAEAVELGADLVVDASGRSSGLDRWLGDLGRTVPEKRIVPAKITYTTMTFDRPEQELAFDLAYQMTFAPGVPRGGALLAVEGERWTCSLFGFGDHVPPTDDKGYLDFAEDLDNAELAERIRRRTVQERVYRYTNANGQWNLHHRSKDWPERLIAVGDALCVFNPVYGQGLTVAAMEADLLHGLLTNCRTGDGTLTGLTTRYRRGAARLILAPWTLSSNSDLMWSSGTPPLPVRFAHWYNTQVFAVAVGDPAVWTRFVKVVNMVAAPTALFHPVVLGKVARHALARRTAARREAARSRAGAPA
ncbi:FAD-dependent oxidoreductase [Kitasatospora sp. NPDC054939]